MEKVVVGNATLTNEVSGIGEPVIFVHGAPIAELFRPLLSEPSVSNGYQSIIYHRRGYQDSTHASGPVSMAQQVSDCRALLRHLGIERAHFVGHSLGGCIVVQLAMDYPDVVHSLTLLEPALFGVETGEEYRASLARAEQRYAVEQAEVVVDDFLRMRFGYDYRTDLEQVLPGAFEQAVADAGATFDLDLPGLREWHFNQEEVIRLTQPVLNVPGGQSEDLWARFGEVYRLIYGWLPQMNRRNRALFSSDI
jgi:pimeloyl-ACP methyl ester carboxylesterase